MTFRNTIKSYDNEPKKHDKRYHFTMSQNVKDLI